ncbi:MAG: SseB family protein [Fusicatenibacter sp.]
MTVDNTFTIKKLQSLEHFFVTFSQITKMPYAECDPETFDDQIYLFTEEEKAKEFAKSYVEKNIPLLTVKVLRKQMANFFLGLYAEGVNMLVYYDGVTTNRLEIEKVFPKPNEEKIAKEPLPMLNPSLQLTVIYFLQELRRPNQSKDDMERNRRLREMEEEMLVNLTRSNFIMAIDISQVKGEFDPKHPGPDIRIPYIKNQKEEIFQPIYSDIGEFRKFQRDPNAKIRLASISFGQLLPYLMKNAKGFVLNPADVNLLLSREQLERIMGMNENE